MSSKAALKAIRTALDAKDYATAIQKSQDLVSQDPTNYHGNVFLGLANDKLNKNDESEKAYLAATRIKPDDRTAWQGLISLYEKQQGQKLDAYREVVLKLGEIFANSDELERCQDLVNKYTKLAKSYGTATQQKQALELQLPTSPLYGFLEGRLPHPSLTYLRLIEIAEPEEREFINREIGERRTRLGARIDQVTLEVRREAFKKSGLKELYRGIIDWTNDDDVRRKYEEKLLQRSYDELEVASAKDKRTKRNELIRGSQDMVIIKHPFELAWKIVLEWKDVKSYSEYDVGTLREFRDFFPETGLSKVLKGFLEKSDDATTNLILMVDGLDLARDSIIAHRIVSERYLALEEYESAIDVARKGLLNVKEAARVSGANFIHTTDALNTTLANSLIYHQSPRYHPEAKGIFEEILQRDPTSTSCLLGIGLIFMEDHDHTEAVNLLERASERDPSNVKILGELAWARALNGDLETGLHDLQDALARLKEEQPDNKASKAVLLYRIGYCQWELDPSPVARKNRQGAYSNFLASIQANMNYAPAYTSLGFFYADYKGDKGRATRCFHKAFELSSDEIQAAERLSDYVCGPERMGPCRGRRTTRGGLWQMQACPGSKRTGYSWPYSALGTVQINKQQYTQSITSYHAALRISPHDYHCWVGLAESYHHSGRYIAATKAFEFAQTLEENLSDEEKKNVWYAHYMLANVRRELGEYDAAIAAYQDILRERANEVGNSIALIQTLTENSWKSLKGGMFNNAAEYSIKAIHVARDLAKERADIFNLWKSVGDAYSNFTYIKIKVDRLLSLPECKELLATQLDPTALDILADVDRVGNDWLKADQADGSVSADACICMAILAYKRAIHISAQDVHARAVAWYNLGWAEYRAYRSVQPDPGSKGKRPRRFLKAAMRCFKRAIELEAGNSEFWNALGVATTVMSPKVAQHSFVRSLHLNERNVQAWTNLGALYLLHNDIELANQAFTRAQSTDPDYPHAWIGQGMIAMLCGDPKEARGIFEHAFDISGSSSTLSKRQYSQTFFDQLVSSPTASNEVSQLIQPFFALHQLCAQDPSDLASVHLKALLAERMGEISDAESSLQAVLAGMEAEYEETESPASLSKYAQANADMGRVLLACHDYEQAAEKAELALTLSGEEDAEKFDPEACQKLRLSAHLTAGLAHYFMKSMDTAIDMFRDALQEADNAPDVVCLLAQVLWAKGGEEEQSVARQQLLDCVERNPDHVGAITLLGTIALLDKDQDAIDALDSDIRTMITRDDIHEHERAKLLKLQSAISALGNPQGWKELSAASGKSYAALVALDRALHSIPPHGDLDAEDLSRAYAQTGRLSDAYRAIMVAPHLPDGWIAVRENLPKSKPKPE
ncbi:hypothetical protein N7470_005363 [Penicillium chermesinum]|nr:hypothetical protein N7470_005363 [Penicillium chermesinum]